MQQQRTVVTTAIILAFVLSAALWYSLSRPFTASPNATPSIDGAGTPAATPFTFASPGVPEAAAPSVSPVAIQSTPTSTPAPVIATAPTGMPGYLLITSVLAALAGGAGIARLKFTH